MRGARPLLAACPPLLAVVPSVALACDATLAEHDALVSDMTVAQVTETVGCEGALIGERTADGVQLDSYIWEGNGASGSNMILLFANDRLLNRTQIGLQ